MLIDVVHAQSNFETLLDRVREGDDIVITRGGVPIARLVVFESQITKRKVRIGGLRHVDLGLSADFHAPMTDDDLLARAK